MITQMINIKTQEGICDTFIAYPDQQGQYPAVLFFMDGFGLRDYLFKMAQMIAARGFYVILPNLFYRIGPAPVTDIKFPIQAQDLPEASKKLMELFQTYNPELAMRDSLSILEFISHQKQVLPTKIAVTGYCMGGGLAIRAAARFPDQIALAASFHAGKLATDDPNSPHHLLKQIKAELYIAHADKDKSMPADQIEKLERALKDCGLKYQTELYAGASHGFTMADLPAYNADALKRHWNKLFILLERTFKSGGLNETNKK